MTAATPKPRRRRGRKLSDRERILMTIIDRLSSTLTLARSRAGSEWSSEAYRSSFGEGYYVHFAPWAGHSFGTDTHIPPGTLVLCQTGPIDRWKIAFMVEDRGRSEALLREIGSDRLCRMGNENFIPILGLEPQDLYDREQYVFYSRTRTLMYELREIMPTAEEKADGYAPWPHMFAGIEYAGSRARVWVRERYGINERPPYHIDIDPWHDEREVAVSEAAIEAALRAGGFGKRAFLPNPEGVPT